MLTYTLAGFGSRALAAIVDTFILMLLMVLVGILLGLSQVTVSSAVGKVFGKASGSTWAFALFVLIEFALVWGYFVFFEGINDGQTPGKRLFKLRVVRDGGYSITFAASAVRNLIRFLDAQPGLMYAVGAISILVTKSSKRLGDIVAGTFVVHEGEATYDYGAAPARAAGESGSLLPVLSESEYELLERFIARRSQLETERRRALTVQVASRLAAHLDPAAKTQAAALIALFERERTARASTVAGRSDTGTQREQHAIVALGVKRWNEFSTLLAQVRQRGLRSMTPEQVSDFVERYRQITADLAHLQTAARGRTFDALFFVSRSVAGGHAVLYRGRSHTTRRALDYIMRDIPQEIRRSAGAIGLAALLLFGPAIAAYTVVVEKPATAAAFLPPVMIQRANAGRDNIRRHRGYVTIAEEARPMAASFIITNNVQISYGAFALGLTAGIGTVVMLVINGVMLGGGAGIFAVKGVAPLLWAFVAPHGVLELSAICLAGGGGFLLATAMLLPGALTRREAFVIQGRRAIRLITAATLFLLVAGTIEGLISPRVWPIAWKFAVSALTAVAMLAYLSLGWRGQSAERSLSSR